MKIEVVPQPGCEDVRIALELGESLLGVRPFIWATGLSQEDAHDRKDAVTLLRFTAQEADALVVFCPRPIGQVVVFDAVPAGGLWVRQESLLCFTPGVRIEQASSTLSTKDQLFFKVSGKGQLVLGTHGGAQEQPVRKSFVVSLDHLVAVEARLTVQGMRSQSGWQSVFFGKAPPLVTLVGEGTLWMQTRPAVAALQFVAASLPARSE